MFPFKKAMRSLRGVFLGFRKPTPPLRPRPTISNPIANLEEIEIPGTGRYIDLDSSRPHLTLDVPETSLHIQFGPDGERIGIYEAVLERPTSSLARTLHRLSLEGRVQRYSPKSSRARSTSLISASPLASLYYDVVRRPTTPDDLVQSRKPRLLNPLTQAYHYNLGAEPSTTPFASTDTMAYITRPRKNTHRDSCTLPGGFHQVPQRIAPVYNPAHVVEPPTDAMSTGAYSNIINESYRRSSNMFGEAHPGAGEYYCSAEGRPGTPGGALRAAAPDDEDVSAETVGTSSAGTGVSGVSTDATSAPTTTTCPTSVSITTAPIATTDAGTATIAAPTRISKIKKIKQKVKDVFGKLRNKRRSHN